MATRCSCHEQVDGCLLAALSRLEFKRLGRRLFHFDDFESDFFKTATSRPPVRTATGTLWNRNFLQPKLSQLTDLLPIRPALPNADSHGKVCSCGSGSIRSGRRLRGEVFAGGAKVHHDHDHQQAETGHIRQRASSHAAHRRHGQARYGSSVSGRAFFVNCAGG